MFALFICFKAKQETLENLYLQNNMESLAKAKYLSGVHWTKATVFITQICGLILLPIAIDNRGIIVEYIFNIIRSLLSYI